MVERAFSLEDPNRQKEISGIRNLLIRPTNQWHDDLREFPVALVRLHSGNLRKMPEGVFPIPSTATVKLPGSIFSVVGDLHIHERNLSIVDESGIRFPLGEVNQETAAMVAKLEGIPVGGVLRLDDRGNYAIHPDLIVAATLDENEKLPDATRRGIQGFVDTVSNEPGKEAVVLQDRDQNGTLQKATVRGSLTISYEDQNGTPIIDRVRRGDYIATAATVRKTVLGDFHLVAPQTGQALFSQEFTTNDIPGEREKMSLFLRYLTAATGDNTDPLTRRITPVATLYKTVRELAAEMRDSGLMTRQQANALLMHFAREGYDPKELPVFFGELDRDATIASIDERWGNGRLFEGNNSSGAFIFFSDILRGENPGRADLPGLTLDESVRVLGIGVGVSERAYRDYKDLSGGDQPLVILRDIARELKQLDSPEAVEILLHTLRFSVENRMQIPSHSITFYELFEQSLRSLIFLVDENHSPKNREVLKRESAYLNNLSTIVDKSALAQGVLGNLVAISQQV